MTDVGMANDGMGHVHAWNRDRQPCECGQSVPAYLLAAWDRYSDKTGSTGS